MNLVSCYFLLVCWSCLGHLPGGGGNHHGGVSAMYDRDFSPAGNNKPVVRLIKSCGKKVLRKPYRVITVKETRNWTNYVPPPGDYHYYFYNYYFQSCNFDFICFEEFLRASQNGNDKLVLNFLQNGTSFWFEAYDLNPYTWHVANLLEVFQKYNVSAKGYKFIHEGDETRDYAHKNLVDFYGIWEKSYRTYWWDVPEYRELHAANQLDWLPSRFLHSPEIPFVQQKISSRRVYNVTFIGNTNTNVKRAAHVAEFQSKMNITVEGLVTSTGGQHGVNFIGGTKYLDTMLDSRFCLQFKGRSTECHRLYESFECSCIPVFIDTWSIVNYAPLHQMNLKVIGETFPWQNSSNLPFMIWVRNVEEFKKVYHRYVNSTEGLKRLDQLQANLMTWWEQTKSSIQKYFTQEFCTAS
jgi:hypothetical protein